MQPFQRHPAELGSLESYAGQLADQAASALEANDVTSRAYQPAIDNWAGLGAPELQGAPARLLADSQDVGQALAWAGVATWYWADQVRQFNSVVDTIDQGPHYGATGENGDPPTDDAIDAARSAAQQRWWTAYNTHILDGGNRVAAMLRDGPTQEHLRAAGLAGGASPFALVASLYQLSGDGAELAEFLADHPEQAAALLPLLNSETKREIAQWLVDHQDSYPLERLALASGFGSLVEMVVALRRPDLTARERELVLQAVDELRDEGFLAEDEIPGDIYLNWIMNGLDSGYRPEELISFARQEGHATMQAIQELDRNADSMSDRELAEFLLANPGAPSAVLQTLQTLRPEVLEILASEWNIEAAGVSSLTGSASVFSLPCITGSEGYIVGPDGRTYEVVVPQRSDEPAFVGTDVAGPRMIPYDSGWHTVDSRTGTVAFGESQVGLNHIFARFVVGYTPVDVTLGQDSHSVGQDQADYLVTHEDGTAELADGNVPAHPPQYSNGPSPPDETPGLQAAFEAMESANNAQVAENDRHWAHQVVFQETDQGDRRAVVLLRQVRADGEAIEVAAAYGGFDQDDNLVFVESGDG